eukprot:ctg_2954.g399
MVSGSNACAGDFSAHANRSTDTVQCDRHRSNAACTLYLPRRVSPTHASSLAALRYPRLTSLTASRQKGLVVAANHSRCSSRQRAMESPPPVTLRVIQNENEVRAESTARLHVSPADHSRAVLASDLCAAVADGCHARALCYDSGYLNTVMARSSITFVDGERGVMRYRGYPIEQLAERSTFLETAFLLIFGQLPTASQLHQFTRLVADHSYLHTDVGTYIRSFTGVRGELSVHAGSVVGGRLPAASGGGAGVGRVVDHSRRPRAQLLHGLSAAFGECTGGSVHGGGGRGQCAVRTEPRRRRRGGGAAAGAHRHRRPHRRVSGAGQGQAGAAVRFRAPGVQVVRPAGTHSEAARGGDSGVGGHAGAAV